MNKERRKRIAAVIDELTTIREEEQEAYENTPESIQNGDRGSEMQDAIIALDSSISELENIQ